MMRGSNSAEVWLDFHVGFTLENRSDSVDAIQISVDAFETRRYRATPSTLPLLRHGDTPALAELAARGETPLPV